MEAVEIGKCVNCGKEAELGQGLCPECWDNDRVYKVKAKHEPNTKCSLCGVPIYVTEHRLLVSKSNKCKGCINKIRKIGGNSTCPRCNSKRVYRNGFLKNKIGEYQKYRCFDCRLTFKGEKID